jgi:hypothetical protein
VQALSHFRTLKNTLQTQGRVALQQNLLPAVHVPTSKEPSGDTLHDKRRAGKQVGPAKRPDAAPLNSASPTRL